MNFAKRKRPVVDVLFILVLLAVFIISALFVVVFGTKVYSKTVNDADENFEKRTAFYYISNKIDSFDEEGMISLKEIEGKNMLILSSIIEGNEYVTYLYTMDGYLKEITTPKELEFDYHNGNNIMEIEALDMEMVSDSLIRFKVTGVKGSTYSFYKNITSGGASR